MHKTSGSRSNPYPDFAGLDKFEWGPSSAWEGGGWIVVFGIHQFNFAIAILNIQLGR